MSIDTDRSGTYCKGYNIDMPDVKVLFQKMAKKFPGAVLVFDSCNRRGAK